MTVLETVARSRYLNTTFILQCIDDLLDLGKSQLETGSASPDTWLQRFDTGGAIALTITTLAVEELLRKDLTNSSNTLSLNNNLNLNQSEIFQRALPLLQFVFRSQDSINSPTEQGDRIAHRNLNGIRKAWRAYCGMCALQNLEIQELSWASRASWSAMEPVQMQQNIGVESEVVTGPFGSGKESTAAAVPRIVREDHTHTRIFRAIKESIDPSAVNEFTVAKDFIVDIFLPKYNLCLEINGPAHYIRAAGITNTYFPVSHSKSKDFSETGNILDVPNGPSVFKAAVIRASGYNYLALGGNTLCRLTRMSSFELKQHLAEHVRNSTKFLDDGTRAQQFQTGSDSGSQSNRKIGIASSAS